MMSDDRNKTTWRRIERTHRDAPGAEVTNGTWGDEGPVAKLVDQLKRTGQQQK